MAKYAPDGAVVMEDGSQLYADDPVVVGQLPELVELFTPPPPQSNKAQGGMNFVSGGGGRQGPPGPRGATGPQGPPGPGGANGWVDDGTVVRLQTATDQVAVGAATPFGTEKLLVVGDVRVDGAVQLLGGGPLFFESEDNSGAPVSGPSTGRIRYNDTTGTWQISTQGSAYADIGTATASGWTDDGAIVRLTDSGDSVAIGTAALVGTEKLRLTGGTALFDFTSLTAFSVTQTGGGTPALVVDTTNSRVGIGGAPGAFALDVTGAARVTGKLTVTGAIDPPSVSLSGGTALFFESDDGSTAGLSGASAGRIRYNNTTGTWQVSTQGAAYVDIATGGGGGSPWQTTAGVVNLVTSGDTVTIGSATSGGKLFIDGDTDETQVQIRGFAGQFSNLLSIETSGGATELFGFTPFGQLLITTEDDNTSLSVVNEVTVTGSALSILAEYSMESTGAVTAGFGFTTTWSLEQSTGSATTAYRRIVSWDNATNGTLQANVRHQQVIDNSNTTTMEIRDTSFAVGSYDWAPGADNVANVGTNVVRMASVNSAQLNAFGAASDANPIVRLGSSGIDLGVGGGTATDVNLSRGAADRLDLASGDSFTVSGGGFLIVGGTAQSGSELLRVVGDARVEGKLTVTGSLDPTDLLLSGGGTAHFFESNDGSTAGLSGGTTGRLRYNDSTGTWQVSTQGGAYTDLATGAGASPWSTTGTVIHPTTITDEVSVGGTGTAGKLTVFGDSSVQVTGVLRAAASQSTNILECQNSAAATMFRVSFNGGTDISVPATSGSSPTSLRITGASHTGLLAGVPFIEANFSLARIITWTTGAVVPNYRGQLIGGATLEASAPTQTITTAATLEIDAAPTASTNVTVTNGPYAVLVDSGNVRIDDALIIGATALSGSENLRVVGDARVEGKLTVTGSIDPTDVSLSGGTALFFESDNGSTAGLSGASTGRIRYNNSTGNWEVSTQGGAYVQIATGAGGSSPWQTTSNVANLITSTDTVTIGSSSAGGKLFIDGDADVVQLQVRANGTQTANLLVIENSGGTDQIVVDSSFTLRPNVNEGANLGTIAQAWDQIIGRNFEVYNGVGDTEPSVHISEFGTSLAGIRFGPGGATAVGVGIIQHVGAGGANLTVTTSTGTGAGNLLPEGDGAGTLGSADFGWNEIAVGDTGNGHTVYNGPGDANPSVSITEIGTGLGGIAFGPGGGTVLGVSVLQHSSGTNNLTIGNATGSSAGNLLPVTDGTGTIGNASFGWNEIAVGDAGDGHTVYNASGDTEPSVSITEFSAGRGGIGFGPGGATGIGVTLLQHPTPAGANLTVANAATSGAANLLPRTDGSGTLGSADFGWNEIAVGDSGDGHTVYNSAGDAEPSVSITELATGVAGVAFGAGGGTAAATTIFQHPTTGAATLTIGNAATSGAGSLLCRTNRGADLGSIAFQWDQVISMNFEVYNGTGDTEPMIRIGDAGTVGAVDFGPGGAVATDVRLSRGATDRLDLATGDSFNLVSGSILFAATTVLTGTVLTLGTTSLDSTSSTLTLGSDTAIARVAANILGPVAGDAWRIDATSTLQFGTDIGLSRGAANRLDMDAGDSFLISDTGALLFGADVQLDRGAANRLDLGSGDDFFMTGDADFLFNSTDVQDGVGVMAVANANTNPSTDPSGGGILYSTGGAGTWRGSGGTTTTFGPAGPHCGNCGADMWRVAAINHSWKAWRYECGYCDAVFKGGPQSVLHTLNEEEKKSILRDGMEFDEVARAVGIAA